MKKADLIDRMASRLDVSRKYAGEVLDAALDVVSEGLQEDEAVQIMGFGTFKVSHRAARKGHNPRTREPIDIPASKSVRFTPSASLKSSL